MQLRRLIRIGFASCGVGLGCLFPSGCGDESKTTGTQLQLSAEDKAQIEDMRATMKAQRATAKKEQADHRKKK